MKFRCDRDLLSEGLQTVQRGVSSRPGIPALTGVLMEAGSGGTLTLTTTDLEVSARLTVEVRVQEEGVALVPARLLSDTVKSLSDAPVEFRNADGATITTNHPLSKTALWLLAQAAPRSLSDPPRSPAWCFRSCSCRASQRATESARTSSRAAGSRRRPALVPGMSPSHLQAGRPRCRVLPEPPASLQPDRPLQSS